MVSDLHLRPLSAAHREIIVEVARVTPRGEAIVIRTEQRPGVQPHLAWPADDDD